MQSFRFKVIALKTVHYSAEEAQEHDWQTREVHLLYYVRIDAENQFSIFELVEAETKKHGYALVSIEEVLPELEETRLLPNPKSSAM